MENNNTKQMDGKKIIESIAIVVGVVIMAVIGALVVGSILDSSSFSNIITSSSASNETILEVSNVTLETVSNAGLTSFAMVLGIVTNATDGVIISSGNYTSTSNGTIIATNAGALSSFNGTDWNVSYTYTFDSGNNPTRLNVTQVGDQFGSFITGLLAFLAIIGTIVGVVWLVFYVKMLFNKNSGISTMTA